MDYMMRSLVVGIDEYADVRYRDTSSLQYARSDALSIGQVLRDSRAFRLEGGNIHLLINQKADADTVCSVMNNLFSSDKLNRRTIAFFYFAGHGVWKDGRVFLCCHDVDFANPGRGGIELDQVYRWLINSSADCTIAILDACFSGGFTTNAQDSTSIAEQVRRSFIEASTPDGKTVAIFAACQGDQQARENRALGHGLFTYRLLRGWQGDGIAKDPDGLVTLSSLKNYLLYHFENELQQTKLILGSASRIPLWKVAQPLPEQVVPPGFLQSSSTRSLPPTTSGAPVVSSHNYLIEPVQNLESRSRLNREDRFRLESGSRPDEVDRFTLETPVSPRPRMTRRTLLIFLGIFLLMLIIVIVNFHG